MLYPLLFHPPKIYPVHNHYRRIVLNFMSAICAKCRRSDLIAIIIIFPLRRNAESCNMRKNVVKLVQKILFNYPK